jgi:4-hydroxybenzoyl-CoA reductase subunit beta
MSLPDHQFEKPSSLKDSLALLATRSNVKLMGGGTDVVFNMRGRLFTPDTLISLRGIRELAFVRETEHGGLELGAATRLTDLVANDLIARRFPALSESFRAVASRHVRNMATLGGNMCLETRCWYTNQSEQWREAHTPCFKTGGDVCHVIQSSRQCVALNNADTPPMLIALGAQAVVSSPVGERTIALRNFYQTDGIKHTVLEPNEILTKVIIPPPERRAVFMKVTPRKGIDFAYGAVAATASGTGSTAIDPLIVLGSLSTAPIILQKPAEIVARDGLGDEAIAAAVAATRAELGALNNLFTPSSYKRDLANTLVERVCIKLREMA